MKNHNRVHGKRGKNAMAKQGSKVTMPAAESSPTSEQEVTEITDVRLDRMMTIFRAENEEELRLCPDGRLALVMGEFTHGKIVYTTPAEITREDACAWLRKWSICQPPEDFLRAPDNFEVGRGFALNVLGQRNVSAGPQQSPEARELRDAFDEIEDATTQVRAAFYLLRNCIDSMAPKADSLIAPNEQQCFGIFHLTEATVDRLEAADRAVRAAFRKAT